MMLGLKSRRGRPLNAQEHAIFQPYFQEKTLLTARIVEEQVPFWLSRHMSAVVLGTHIYLRQGAYQLQSKSGVELFAHELTHVEQYLSGMTILKYLWASRKGYWKNPYEIEAYAKGAYVCEQCFLAVL